MKDAVIIKSSKYGIHLKLNQELPFEELKDSVVQKINDAEKFFRNASFALSFEGRELSSEEEIALVEAINSRTKNRIICIVDENEIKDQVLKLQMEQMSLPEPIDPKRAVLHYGTLHSGQIMEAEESIVILGDVNSGAKVVAGASIIVLGSLNGKAHAGCMGREDAFICALDMNPMQLKIDTLTLREVSKTPLESLRKKRKGMEPQIACIKEGMIVLESVSQGLTNIFS